MFGHFKLNLNKVLAKNVIVPIYMLFNVNVNYIFTPNKYNSITQYYVLSLQIECSIIKYIYLLIVINLQAYVRRVFFLCSILEVKFVSSDVPHLFFSHTK